MTGSRTNGRCSSPVVEDGRKAGYTFSQPDLIIAATALHQGLPSSHAM